MVTVWQTNIGNTEKTKETLLVTNKCVAVLALVFKLLFSAEIMSRNDPCVLKIVFVKKVFTCGVFVSNSEICFDS